MRLAWFTVLSLVLASEARAQDPDWPDPGSEEPGGPKLFPPDPKEERFDESADLDVEAPASIVEPIYRWSWYGWRNLIGDAAAIALAASFFGTDVQYPQILIASALVYAIGGPVAHFTKGNWGRALISFGMRIAGPTVVGLAFFAITAAIDGLNDDTAGLVVTLGGSIGAVLAAGLDVGLVARHRVQVEPTVPQATPNGPKSLSLALQF